MLIFGLIVTYVDIVVLQKHVKCGSVATYKCIVVGMYANTLIHTTVTMAVLFKFWQSYLFLHHRHFFKLNLTQGRCHMYLFMVSVGETRKYDA